MDLAIVGGSPGVSRDTDPRARVRLVVKSCESICYNRRTDYRQDRERRDTGLLWKTSLMYCGHVALYNRSPIQTDCASVLAASASPFTSAMTRRPGACILVASSPSWPWRTCSALVIDHWLSSVGAQP